MSTPELPICHNKWSCSTEERQPYFKFLSVIEEQECHSYITQPLGFCLKRASLNRLPSCYKTKGAQFRCSLNIIPWQDSSLLFTGMPSQDAIFSQEGNTEKEMNVGSQTVMSQVSSVLCFFLIILFLIFRVFFFLAVLGLCCCGGSSPVVASGSYSLVLVCSSQWLLSSQSRGSREHGLHSCSSQALEHRLSSCGAQT